MVARARVQEAAAGAASSVAGGGYGYSPPVAFALARSWRSAATRV
jgi:hypothetical protein